MTKIQTTLKSFSIKPKRDTGDFTVQITFSDHEGPGMIDSILSALAPHINQQVTLCIEPVQMRIGNGE